MSNKLDEYLKMNGIELLSYQRAILQETLNRLEYNYPLFMVPCRGRLQTYQFIALSRILLFPERTDSDDLRGNI